MAKIQGQDVVQQDLFKNTIESGEALLKTLDQLEERFKGILKQSQELIKNNDPLQGFENAENLAKEVDKVTKATEQLRKVEAEQSKVKKQLNSLRDEEVKGKLRLQKANKEQRDILRAQLVLQDAEAGTLEILAARNKLLRIERQKLNLETQEGRDRLEAINRELDENNKQIKDNSDQLKQQRLNVGNYADSIVEAIDRLRKQEKQLTKNIAVLKQQDELTEDARKELIKYEKELKDVNAELKEYGEEVNDANNASQELAESNDGLADSFGKIGKAVAIAATALTAAFTQTQEGSIETRIIIDQLQAVLGVVAGSFGKFAAGIFNTFKAIATASTSPVQAYVDFRKAQQQLTTAFVDFDDKVSSALKNSKALTLQTIEFERAQRGASKRLAVLNGELERAQLLADDTTRSFAERTKQADEALRLRKLIADEEVRIAQQQSNLINQEIDIRKAAGREFESLLDQQAQAQVELINAQQGALTAELDIEKTRRELTQDRVERDLDFELDLFDSIKTLNERRLQDDRLTLQERQAILERTQQLSDDSFRNQQNSINELTKERLDINALLEEDDERVIRERVRAASTSEIAEGRIIEIIKDRRAALQDLAEAERDLEEQREEARVKEVEQQFEALEAVTDKAIEEAGRRRDAEQNRLDRQVQAQADAVSAQEARAAASLDNTLAFEKEKLAEAELARADAEKKREKAERRQIFIETTLSALKAAREATPPEPPGKAIAEGLATTGTILALANAFFDGTDDTGSGGNVDNKGGFMAVLHPNERIFNADQTAQMNALGYTSRDSALEALKAFNMIQTGVIPQAQQGIQRSNGDLLAGMIMLNNSINNIPSSRVSWDQEGNRYETMIRDGFKKTVKHVKKKPRL